MGSNILGIYPGQHYGTEKDKILVVGAHWDTVGEYGNVVLGNLENGRLILSLILLASKVILITEIKEIIKEKQYY